MHDLETLPQALKLQTKDARIVIGVPKETINQEKRVALTPDDVASICSENFNVLIEHNAGVNANFSDYQYSEAGALLVTQKELFEKSSIIVKIAPLTYEEIDLIKPESIVFSSLNLNTQSLDRITSLQEKKITGLAYEYFIDEKGFNPFTHVIGQIVGSSAVMIAAELLSNNNGGRGIMLGGLTGLPPAEIVVLGTDISAEYAVRVAFSLGANVRVFDYSISNLIHFQNLFGRNLYTSTLNYANLTDAVTRANVIINTIEHKQGKKFIITQDLVLAMKDLSVIVDLKIDSGSVIETSSITTLENPIYVKHGVIHYCVPNIASRVAQTSSLAISNLLTSILLKILQQGSIIPLIQYERDLRNATYLFKGLLTNSVVANNLNLQYTDLNLIIHIF